MNASGVSLFRFPRNPSLHTIWNKQVQRTCDDWKDATKYSVLCSEHFTSNCFEEDLFLAAQFGIAKRKHLKPDAVPTVFYRPNAATQTATNYDQETSSVGHK